jgi:hypothetical protein
MAMCTRVVAVVVVLVARAAATDVAVTMVDVNNTMSLADRIAALTCAGLLNRPDAVAAGVSTDQRATQSRAVDTCLWGVQRRAQSSPSSYCASYWKQTAAPICTLIRTNGSAPLLSLHGTVF